VADLFTNAARDRKAENAPLAVRLRPHSLDELVGQQHVLGEGSALRLAIEEDRVPSAILFGPPGTGKTTTARIVAERTGAVFEELSAVSARVDDVRAVIRNAEERLGANGLRTILFIDEIHRFNKMQQDSVLHAVEDGLVTLIGATTENPYFEVNSALLSRCTVIELHTLSEEDVGIVVRRGAAELGAVASDEVVDTIAKRAGGDARAALQILELAHDTARAEGAALAESHVLDAARKRPMLYDRKGDQHYDVSSALIKSIRGSDVDAALHYLARMVEAGEDPRFLARRLVILASEDIGMADPTALTTAVAAAQAVQLIGMPEARLNLAQATIALAVAPKSNAVITAIDAASADVRAGKIGPVPAHLRDAHYAGAKKVGHGSTYTYSHDEPFGIAEQQYAPDVIADAAYYQPTELGAEAAVKQRWERVRRLIRGQ